MNILDIINDGWKVEIETVSKRMGDLNNRHWESRVVWKLTKDEYIINSDWEGFVKPQDAIDDMCKKVKEL